MDRAKRTEILVSYPPYALVGITTESGEYRLAVTTIPLLDPPDIILSRHATKTDRVEIMEHFRHLAAKWRKAADLSGKTETWLRSTQDTYTTRQADWWRDINENGLDDTDNDDDYDDYDE